MFRDTLKTLSFALLHFTVGVTYALTGSVTIAAGVALIEPSVNTVVFFLHERVWRRLADRSQKSPDRKPARRNRHRCRLRGDRQLVRTIQPDSSALV